MTNRKSPNQQIEALEKKKAQIDARLAKKKAQLRGQSRKEDTRRKIIAGALALEHMAHDNKFRATMEKLLRENVTRENDKRLFDL